MLKNEKVLLFTLAALQFTNIMDFMIMMPMAPQLREVFHIDNQQFNLLVASYNVFAGVSGISAAFWADKFDRRTTLLIIYVGFLIGTLACAISPSYEALLFARALAGIFGGLISSTVHSIVGDVIPAERRATAMGMVMMGFAVAAAWGVPMGNYLAQKYTWHLPFWVIVAMGTGVFFLAYNSVPPVNAHLISGKKPNPWHRIKEVLSNPSNQLALLLMFFLMMGQFSVIPNISQYAIFNVGMPKDAITYIYLIGGVVTIFSNPIIGRISDRIGKKRMFNYLLLASLLPLFAITQVQKVPAYVFFTITSVFFLTIAGRMVPASAVITGTANPQNRGTFMAINSSVQQLSSGIAAYISSLMISETVLHTWEGFDYVGYFAMGTSLITLVIMKKLSEK